MDAALLKRALGPKPSAQVLCKAVQGGGEGEFFEPLVPQEVGETVAEFVAAGRERRVTDALDRLDLVPVGATPEQMRLVQEARSMISAFLAPVRVTVRQVKALGDPSRLRLFRGANDPSRQLDGDQVLQSLERDLDHGAAFTLAVCFSPCKERSEDPSKRVMRSRNAAVGLFCAAGLEGRGFILEARRAALAEWSGMAPCGYFVCAMNRTRRRSAPDVLCPICLRKLSLAVGGGTFDVVARYVELFRQCASPGWGPDAQWIAERLAYLGEFAFLDQLASIPAARIESVALSVESGPHPHGREALPHVGTQRQLATGKGIASVEAEEASRMRSDLSTLKARMGRAAKGPTFG